MKRCSCGRLATHAIQMFAIDGEPTTKKLACDQFPDCRPTSSKSPAHRGDAAE